MKNLTNYLLILLLFLLPCFTAKAQKGDDVIRQVSCFDVTLKSQADSLKLLLYKQGFVVVREATMTMESEYEMPIIVPLNEGSWYHVAFIGDMSSKLYEVRMYDQDDKQVVYQKHFGDGMESNVIIYYRIFCVGTQSLHAICTIYLCDILQYICVTTYSSIYLCDIPFFNIFV